ncbi:uncharacterized protein DSM5745_09489 [Aspergillus mulundensis]|uniref:F-box domain-containing protein n=1 Tax=Aspergillus mulundensis TaxID=1810919 RepID=A0A3D8QVR3_9EURO|nr:hypothetical protein DSM5745_09489 [Aspergillus mulundensis]RDW65750.1 hypothetical protein DSM5745_09489 [Aspergillus mulundensis]
MQSVRNVLKAMGLRPSSESDWETCSESLSECSSDTYSESYSEPDSEPSSETSSESSPEASSSSSDSFSETSSEPSSEACSEQDQYPPLTPNLCHLPLELIGEIAIQLSIHDIRRLRCVSSYLNQATFDYFAKEQFKELKTDLSLQSIIELDRLTENPYLASCVKHLLITSKRVRYLDHVQFGSGFGFRYGEGFEWRRGKAGRLITNQKGIDYWEIILRQLVSCRSVTLQRPFQDNRARSQRGNDSGALPWALAGTGDEREEYGDLWPDLTLTEIHVLPMAIMSRGGLKLETYTLDFGRLNRDPGHQLDMKSIDTAHLQDPVFQAAWSNIREFHVVSEFKEGSQCQYIVDLLFLAPNLHSLTLDFDHSTWAYRFVYYLGTVEQHLPFKLKSLKIKRGDFGGGTNLTKVICKHSDTLEHLALQEICLRRHSLHKMLKYLDENGLPSLKSLTLEEISYADTTDGRRAGLAFRDPIKQGVSVDEDTGGQLEYVYYDNGFYFDHPDYVGSAMWAYPSSKVLYSGPRADVILKKLDKARGWMFG